MWFCCQKMQSWLGPLGNPWKITRSQSSVVETWRTPVSPVLQILLEGIHIRCSHGKFDCRWSLEGAGSGKQIDCLAWKSITRAASFQVWNPFEDDTTQMRAHRIETIDQMRVKSSYSLGKNSSNPQVSSIFPYMFPICTLKKQKTPRIPIAMTPVSHREATEPSMPGYRYIHIDMYIDIDMI